LSDAPEWEFIEFMDSRNETVSFPLATPLRRFVALMHPWQTLLAIAVALSTISCGYNEIIDRDEDVKGAWAEVQNQYKRRADVVPNLVQTVKASAAFETDTLQKVVEARSKVATMKVDSSTIDDPAKLKQFEQAQNQLSGALSRLMVVVEKYPELKSTEGFRDLQSQLEGTENRISVARNRYIGAVAEYNKTAQRFPTSIGAKMRGKGVRPTFEGDVGTEKPPEVKF
jgi:LemA protein